MSEEEKINSETEITEQESPSIRYDSGYVVGIGFGGNHKSYYFHTEQETLQEGTAVVVETIRGLELGNVVKAPQPIDSVHFGLELKPVIRIATEQDLKDYQVNLELSKKAMEVAAECINRHQLEMHLLRADYTLDASKVIITYSAENRVDFRELLKDLAGRLKCRIDLRQIGTRDRSKLIGGIGICGLPLCCNQFLGEFDGISINMAKNQFLALNIQKLSGHCGKLICCLKYENDDYSELRKGLPKMGQKLKIEGELYKIMSVNVLTQQVRLENQGNILMKPLAEIMTMYRDQILNAKQVESDPHDNN